MSKGTVFIVDDDQELLELLKIRIESAGYHVLSTPKGEQAFDLIQEAVPDAVVLDVFLPNVDGLTILKRLKSPIDIETGKPSKTKDIPVIVLTGKAPMIENMTRLEGAVDFFVKPLDTEKFFFRLFNLLEVAHHERETKSR